MAVRQKTEKGGNNTRLTVCTVHVIQTDKFNKIMQHVRFSDKTVADILKEEIT
jgi:hypothetical protein